MTSLSSLCHPGRSEAAPLPNTGHETQTHPPAGSRHPWGKRACTTRRRVYRPFGPPEITGCFVLFSPPTSLLNYSGPQAGDTSTLTPNPQFMDYPLHLGMPIENFHLLPRSEGWNYCYQNGIAHVTPARILVDYSLDLTAFTHPRYGVNHARVDYRPPRQEERTRLGELFVESFRDTIDFAGYPESIFATWANDFLTRFFSPTNSEMAPNSLLAFDPSDGQLLAGALLNSSSCGEPLLDALFVGSGHRHQGIATSLASPVAAPCHVGKHGQCLMAPPVRIPRNTFAHSQQTSGTVSTRTYSLPLQEPPPRRRQLTHKNRCLAKCFGNLDPPEPIVAPPPGRMLWFPSPH